MIYIDKQQELDNLCIKLNQKTQIAIDFEFIREISFTPILCLIQIATEKEVFIIDPLKLELRNLLAIFTNPQILKILHASNQDIDVLYKNFALIIFPIFDTQIAGAFLGYGNSISYAKLVVKLTDNIINKSASLTNWQLRPLSKQQLEYAANDVQYLFILHQELQQKLESLERLSWCKEEHLNLYNPKNYQNDSNNAWKKIKYSKAKPFFLNYLRALAKFREELAKQKNTLPKFIIKDEIIAKLAYLQPQNQEEINNDRILKKSLPQKFIKEIIAICNITKDEKEELLLADYKKLSRDQELIADLLKLYLKYIANKLGIASKYIATSNDIRKFLFNGNAKFLSGWRYKTFGKIVQEITEGKATIKIIAGSLHFSANSKN